MKIYEDMESIWGDKQGRSPLTLAVMNGHTLLASHLIHRRALVEQADSSGNSPLHYALAYGRYGNTCATGLNDSL